MNNASVPWNEKTHHPTALDRLNDLRARNPITADDPAFVGALSREAAKRLRAFLTGLRRYRDYPVLNDTQPAMPVIWQNGTTQLRDYNPAQPEALPVLVIPSLINRFGILDLDGQSFLRTLAGRGFRPLLVDWNSPADSERDFAIGDYVTQRLLPILDHLARPVALAGYCMGGNLALALAALRPDRITNLTLMATPWDFHQPAARAQQLQSLAIENLVTDGGGMPVDAIQSLFALMQPINTLDKFIRFAALEENSAEARRFVRVEDWLNDGVPLTAKVARESLQDWYGGNHPIQGQWRIDGHSIDPSKLDMPAYILVPGKDRIVPPESALPLARLLPRATVHQPICGHIGLMAGRHAPAQVWQAWFEWLKGI